MFAPSLDTSQVLWCNFEQTCSKMSVFIKRAVLFLLIGCLLYSVTFGATATCRHPHISAYDSYDQQKDLSDKVHAVDPDVVFEACIFECISNNVNTIPIPAYVFEAFDLPVKERNFSFDAMCFDTGSYLDMWGAGTSVPI